MPVLSLPSLSMLRLCGLLLTSFALVGCANQGNALVANLALAFGSSASVDNAVLDPSLRYLRLSRGSNVALAVLGYVDNANGKQATEVWYTASGEVIRLRDGRLFGTTGLDVDWRAVRWPDAQPWEQLLATALSQGSTQYQRQRDVMPGYRLNIVESVRLQPTAAVSRSGLVQLRPETLQWFEESTQLGNDKPLLARYGVSYRSGQPQVIYGEQCLTPELCIQWQRWPADDAA